MAGTHSSGSADDTLTGGAGVDTFFIGPDDGDDTITDFANGEDLIDLKQFSTISSFSDLTITSDDNGVMIDLSAHGGGTIFLQGFSVDDLDASDFVFAIIGTDNADTLDGDAGDDVMRGGAGDDTLLGNEGTDTLYGGDDNDGLWGHAGDDTLYGGEGNDTLYGDAVHDPADTGDDTLYGGEGNDRMWGHAGDDALYGGEGNDTLYGDAARDGAYQGVYTGDDTLYGGEGNDTLEGGKGNDTLYGGEGDDTLYGDESDDSGDEGDDTFVFQSGHGNDTIKDFTDGDDLIDLSALADVSGFDDLSITADGTTAVIDLSAQGGGTIRLENVDVADLDAGDFVFQEPTVEGL